MFSQRSVGNQVLLNQAKVAKHKAQLDADLLIQQLDNAHARLKGADEYVLKLTDRSRELLFFMMMKDSKQAEFMKRLQAAYPAEAKNIQQMQESASSEIEDNEVLRQKVWDEVCSQPVFPEKQEQQEQEVEKKN